MNEAKGDIGNVAAQFPAGFGDCLPIEGGTLKAIAASRFASLTDRAAAVIAQTQSRYKNGPKLLTMILHTF